MTNTNGDREPTRNTRAVARSIFILLVAAMALAGFAAHAASSATDPAAVAAANGDYTKARQLLESRAQDGDADAQFNLGVLYASGRGGSRDIKTAIKWYRRAAEQGQLEAQNNLGSAYLEGEGVSRDPAKAANWFRKAAQKGSPGAQYNLGALYAQGNGVERDMGQAVDWWRKAATQGAIAAQYNMGVVNANGDGVEQSDAGAVYWFAAAAASGDPRSREALGPLVKRLPTRQVTASNVRIRAGAGTDSAIIGHANKGERLSVLGRNRDDWAMVYLPKNQRLGWIANRLLSKSASR